MQGLLMRVSRLRSLAIGLALATVALVGTALVLNDKIDKHVRDAQVFSEYSFLYQMRLQTGRPDLTFDEVEQATGRPVPVLLSNVGALATEIGDIGGPQALRVAAISLQDQADALDRWFILTCLAAAAIGLGTWLLWMWLKGFNRETKGSPRRSE